MNKKHINHSEHNIIQIDFNLSVMLILYSIMDKTKVKYFFPLQNTPRKNFRNLDSSCTYPRLEDDKFKNLSGLMEDSIYPQLVDIHISTKKKRIIHLGYPRVDDIPFNNLEYIQFSYRRLKDVCKYSQFEYVSIYRRLEYTPRYHRIEDRSKYRRFEDNW